MFPESSVAVLFFFFFYLFITRVRPMEIMARLSTVRFLSAVRAVAARCKHPFALRPGLSPESVTRTLMRGGAVGVDCARVGGMGFLV